MKNTLQAADLFAGAGGFSTGLLHACADLERTAELLAVNHWPRAIETHSLNHPGVRHLCENLDNVDPRKVHPGGRLNILLASPECVHFSNARGGVPMSDQSRASAWHIVRWADALRIDNIIVENVREFCFPSGTVVVTDNGLLPIEEVEVGMRVLTHKGRYRAVTALTSRVANTMRVVGGGNSIIECTDDHPFYSRPIEVECWGGTSGRHKAVLGKESWTEARNLVPDRSNMTTYQKRYSGFAWATPHTSPVMAPIIASCVVNPFDPAFWRMVGLWLGDGWIRHRRGRADGVRICGNHAEADLLESQLKSVCGLTWNRQERASVVVFETTNREMAEWLTAYFGEHAHYKTIPTWALSLPDECKRALIDGYSQADGHLNPRNNRWYAGTVSRRLAVGLKLLLESMGISAGITPMKAGSFALLNGREINGKGGYYLTWKWKKNLDIEWWNDDLHRWTRVRSVTPAQQNVVVYDLTVHEDHSFIADGMVVHNCTWGPLNAKGRPIPHKKGEVFRAWCNALESLGYHVDFDVLNSADYGAATARRRLFIVASRRRKMRWPTRTHSATPELFTQNRHRAAREIIDWSLEGSSIFGRKKPLADKTLARIAAGLKKFGGVDFVMPITHSGGDNRVGRVHDLDACLPTLTTQSELALCEPFLVIFRNNRDAASLDAPLSTITTTGKHHALCEPFIVQFHDDSDRAEKRVYSVEEPLRTLDTSNRYALAEPFMVQFYGQSGAAPCDLPLPTVTTKDHFGLCQPEPIAVFERDGVTYGLMDIRFRMLQPHECAAAMGFEDYEFTGTKKDKMKMIGNAVSVECARALCKAVLQ